MHRASTAKYWNTFSRQLTLFIYSLVDYVCSQIDNSVGWMISIVTYYYQLQIYNKHRFIWTVGRNSMWSLRKCCQTSRYLQVGSESCQKTLNYDCSFKMHLGTFSSDHPHAFKVQASRSRCHWTHYRKNPRYTYYVCNCVYTSKLRIVSRIFLKIHSFNFPRTK